MLKELLLKVEHNATAKRSFEMNKENEKLHLGDVIDWAEVAEISDDYKEILETEKHHQHPIVKDEQGVIRWKEDPLVRFLVDCGDLNRIVGMMNWNKNREMYRELYRKMGYSLSGYWEIFYWEMNNDEAENYKPCR